MQRTDGGHLRLGVNIDHVATLRNARGGTHPEPLRAAHAAAEAGADGITAHLREDRRHIRDGDIEAIRAEIALPLNFEMAATREMRDIALRHKPHAACIVPEKREERTTEGVLDAVVTDFAQPNGLCFSPDETRLYIAESGSSHDDSVPAVIRQFAVEGAQLRDLGVFAEIDNGLPDGIRCDIQGNLWSSAADGVHCFDEAGTLLGKILVPQVVSNICFGGPDGQRMFITATKSVYRVFVDVKGAEPWTRGRG